VNILPEDGTSILNGVGGTCSTNGRNQKPFKSFILKGEGKNALGNLRDKWEDILKGIPKE
jgi:hypothetical protein